MRTLGALLGALRPSFAPPPPPCQGQCTFSAQGRNETSDEHYDIRYDMKDGMIDPYNAGKLFAKLARLVLISDQLNEIPIRDKIMDRLRTYISR